MAIRKKRAFKVWVGIDPKDGPILWSAAETRDECLNAMLDTFGVSAAQNEIVRAALTLSPPPKPKRKGE